MMRDARIGIIGAGFWARYQIAAWHELPGVQIVAIANRTRIKAEVLARAFDIPAIYTDARELLANEHLDAVDIITDVGTHAEYATLAIQHGVAAICQKPMARTLEEAERMVAKATQAGVALFIHENWRWQTPLRVLKAHLDSGVVGSAFRARIQFSSSFPVFENQPALRDLEQFILADIGSHILDVARFLFGDAQRLYCQTARLNPTIRGEDVATVMLQHGNLTCTCEMSYASRLEHERFPETYVLIEAEHGSLELGPDYWLRTTTNDGTHARRYPPPRYAWADPAYDLVQSSIVPCNANLLNALREGQPAETSAVDNLKTVRLVFGAYASAASGRAIDL